MKKFLVITALFSVNSFAGNIHGFVKQQLSVNSTAPVIVVLKTQADFSGMNLPRLPRTERITAVYKTLVKTADETQTNLINLLNSKKSYSPSNSSLGE